MGRAAARRWLPVLLGLAVLGAGCSPGPGVPAATVGTAPAVTDPSPTVPATSTTAVATTASRTAAATTAATTRPPATPPSPGPVALVPPAAGTYRYSTSGSSTIGATSVPFPAVTTLVVDPPVGARQHSTRSLRDATGGGPVTEYTLDYRPEGLFVVALRLTAAVGGYTDSRELRPPVPALLLPTGARPGAHLELDLPVTGGTGSARLVVDVLREEQLAVGGQSVTALVVRGTTTLPPGDLTGRQELTLWIDRGSRLWVRERSAGDATAVGGLLRFSSRYEATLEGLVPT